jgi:hypothetical protein
LNKPFESRLKVGDIGDIIEETKQEDEIDGDSQDRGS